MPLRLSAVCAIGAGPAGHALLVAVAFVAFLSCGAPPRVSVGMQDAATSSAFHVDNEACRTCHKSIFRAWEKSRHAQAWRSPTFRIASENYTLTECLSCHAPDLILATGLGAEPSLRSQGRASGVTCIACHQDATARDWQMHGPYDADSPAHGTVRNEAFQTAHVCESCHGQLPEFDQFHSWQAGPYGQTEFPCQACHMTPRKALLAEDHPNKPKRWVGDHSFPGAYDADQVRAAVAVRLRRAGDELVVEAENQAGHFFPGGDYREAVLTVRLGDEVLDSVRFSLAAGMRIGSGDVWTRSYSYDTTAGAAIASASLTFRRTIGDPGMLVIADLTLDL